MDSQKPDERPADATEPRDPEPGSSGDDVTADSSQLGRIASAGAIDRSEVDALLEGATVGYEELFGEAGTPPRSPDSKPESGSKAPGTDDDPLDRNLHLLRDVNMKVKVELGRGHMVLGDILRLGQGSVVELERLAGDPLDIYVNDKVIARGEVLVLNENFCIRITEIFDPAEVLKVTG